jgi:hypothetical protein
MHRSIVFFRLSNVAVAEIYKFDSLRDSDGRIQMNDKPFSIRQQLVTMIWLSNYREYFTSFNHTLLHII